MYAVVNSESMKRDTRVSTLLSMPPPLFLMSITRASQSLKYANMAFRFPVPMGDEKDGMYIYPIFPPASVR